MKTDSDSETVTMFLVVVIIAFVVGAIMGGIIMMTALS